MAVPQDPRDPAWGDPPLPEKITTFRPAQLQAIDEILWRFEFGAKVVVLDAPTGSGKTLVAEVVRRLLKTRALYMCVDRGLQRQFRGDFTYTRVVMGRANYPTLDYPERFRLEERLSCDDCTFGQKRPDESGVKRCDWCHERRRCPYAVAKREALEAQLACVNTSYFLHEANGPGQFSEWPLIIADEGDRLEDALMSYAEAKISKTRLAEWGLRVPSAFIKGQPDPEDVVAWLDLVEREALQDLNRLLRDPDLDESLSLKRRRRRLENLVEQLDRMKESYPKGGWVVQAQSEESGVTFKPVKVDDQARELLWNHADRWLIMSATMLDPGQLLADLGVYDSWAVVQMPSSFPVANRPIVVWPAADVTARNMEVAMPALAGRIVEILQRHPDVRCLCHTPSYRLMNGLRRLLPESPRHIWLEGAEVRQATIEAYLARPDAVLFAPALDRGLDLPDDACRVVIICKCPWPDLGDPQVNARFNSRGGRSWYSAVMLRSLVQMTGRGVRHDQDWCLTYALDEQVARVIRQYWSKLPGWWVEAVRWSG